MGYRWGVVVLLLALVSPWARGAELQSIHLTVDGVARTALVYLPPQAKTQPTPVVFVFHGHGGSAANAARSFAFDREWPEAISVYPQGLLTPGQLTDPEGKRAGWQASVGDQGDRDLQFFDALLARLKQDFKVDSKRIYVTGHSNGGGFTYLLWLARGDVMAAVAPSSAAARYALELKPKPALILGGQSDPLVKFAWQQMMMNTVRKINGCAPTGEPWEKVCTLYPSAGGTPLVTYVHPGGHQLQPEEPRLIARFFREQAAHP